METTTTTTTTLDPNIYRFEGFRYGLRGTNKYGPDDIIPEQVGLYAFPIENMANRNDEGK